MKGALLAIAILVIVINDCTGECISDGWVPNQHLQVIYPDHKIISVLVQGGGEAHWPDRGFNCADDKVIGRRFHSPSPLAFSANPASLDLQSPPATVELSGQELVTGYGMPTVEFHNQYDVVVAESVATTVSEDGSWMQFNMPDLSYCYTGTVSVWIINKTDTEGGEEVVGYADLNMWDRDPVDADGDGWPSQYDCNDSDPAVNPGASADCTGTYYDRNCDGIPDANQCGSGGGGGGGDGCTQDCYVY